MNFAGEEIFWSRLGWCYDPPRRNPQGRLIFVEADFDSQLRRHKQFYDAGIRVHSSLLFSGWDAPGHYDYSEVDRTLEAIMNLAPDLLYIPRVKLNVPIEWCRENPEEVFVYENGPRGVEDIRELAGGPLHDILGYESPDGYPNAGKWKDDRPNLGGKIALQSFSSGKWLEDAGEALRRFVRRLEDGPYSNRIPAYHIAFGMCGETMLWGSWEYGPGRKIGDYGIHNSEAFFQYGLVKYGSPEALYSAWGAGVFPRNCIPSPMEREGETNRAERLFLSGKNDRICLDYQIFHADVTAGALEHFARIVKQESGGKSVGCFYGYYLGSPGSSYTGHLGLERILQSPWIDFLSSPKGYHRCGPGEPGGEHLPALSVNRKKIYIDEIDHRTHLVSPGGCSDFQEARTLFLREFSKNLQNGSGFWWMDLLGGNFDSPEMMALIAELNECHRKILRQKKKSQSEVLLISDEKSILLQRFNVQLHTQLLKETVAEARLCGVPVDHCRLADLSELDLENYKIAVFLNCHEISDSSVLNLFPSQTLILLHGTCGILCRGTFSLKNVEDLSGFVIEEYAMLNEKTRISGCGILDGITIERHPELFPDYPVFCLRNVAAKCIGRYHDGVPALALHRYRGHEILYSGVPWLQSESLRRIMEYAGVHFFAPRNVIIYGDSRFTGVFSRADCSFTLHFPEKGDYKEFVSGAFYPSVDSIPLIMKAGEGLFFWKQDAC